MPQIYDLPPELVQAIIDHFYDDKRTLKTCTLVCHSWLAPSRYHLFYELSVASFRFEQFALQLDTDPSAFTSVHALRLHTPNPPFIRDSRQIMTPKLLLALIDSLPALHTLKLVAVWLDPRDFELRCTRPTLRLLDISGRIETKALVRTIAMFSGMELEALHIHDVTLITSDYTHLLDFKQILGPHHSAQSWRVHALCFGNPRTVHTSVSSAVHEYLLDILDYLISPDSLAVLDLAYGLDVQTMDKLTHFVAGRASGFTELKIDVTKYQDTSLEPLHQFLDQFTALTALRLTMDVARHFLEGQLSRFGNDLIPASLTRLFMQQNNYTINTKFFPALILPYVPTHIRVLTLCFNGLVGDLHLSKWLEAVKWADFEHLLLRFKSLEELRILTDASKTVYNVDVTEERIQCSIYEAQQAAFVSGLPELYRLGILRF